MLIGLIDLDKKNIKNEFPNITLMKLSAYHKSKGDIVEWYNPNTHYNIVHCRKVFSFTPDYDGEINADIVIKGGSGYAIKNENGVEVYDPKLNPRFDYEIEHIYPDYTIYNINDTAYGFLSMGCPRGCSFCHVQKMQGSRSRRIAHIDEFWNGQKNIVLLDPNITACREWKDILQELIDSKANVDFSQGLDIRLMNEEKIKMLMKIKTKSVHFAWDRYEDKNIIYPKLQEFANITKWNRRKIVVYILVGNIERKIRNEDIERIMLLRPFAYPYVMIYDKENLPRGHELKKLQRWVNNRLIWETCKTFDEYLEFGYKL